MSWEDCCYAVYRLEVDGYHDPEELAEWLGKIITGKRGHVDEPYRDIAAVKVEILGEVVAVGEEGT